MEKEHPLLLCSGEDSNFDNCDSSNDDSNVEITSIIRECEIELICFSIYLRLESENNNHNDQTFEWPDPSAQLLSFSSSDIYELNHSH
ncbi:unnamed protein product [Rotaria sp. Silwood1]|nr:unnamed protein product [Rotaria sp. Silwood1]